MPKIINGYFTSTGAAKFLSLPVLPDMIEIWNKTKWATNTANLAKYGVGFSEDTAGAGRFIIGDGSAHDNNASVTTGGFTFITVGTTTYGAVKTGTAVSQAALAVVTIVAHGYQTGDTVLLYSTTGMLQIAGIPYLVTRIDADTFSIPVVSSGFAAAATAVSAKQVLYPDLYTPFNCYITGISKAASAVVTTSVAHSMVVGQQVLFTVPTGWGMVEMNGLTGYVTAVTTTTFTVNINSSGFTTFAYPTSAVAALGITFPQASPIGDANSGYSGPTVPTPQTIPGAFAPNTKLGVIIGTGDGTVVIHQTSDVIRYRATFPDLLTTS